MHFIGDIFIWSVRSRKESFCSLKKKKTRVIKKKKNVFVGFDFTNTPIFLCRTYWKFRSLKKKTVRAIFRDHFQDNFWCAHDKDQNHSDKVM